LVAVFATEIAEIGDMPLDVELFFHRYHREIGLLRIILRLKQKNCKSICPFVYRYQEHL